MAQIQNVILTLNDGAVLVYSGPVQVRPGEERGISKIVFTEPRELPPEYSLELLPNTENGTESTNVN